MGDEYFLYLWFLHIYPVFFFPRYIVFLEKDTLLPFYVSWLFDLNMHCTIFTCLSSADFMPLMIFCHLYWFLTFRLFFFHVVFVSVDLWVSAKRGFSKTLCLQLLENQKSIILYPLWSFVTVYFQFLNTITILFALIIVVKLLSSGLRSHQIKMRKVEQIASYRFTSGSWECCVKGVSFSVEAKQSFIALFFFSFLFPVFFFFLCSSFSFL